jgi:asparagine synthase (glutamine-hydrolysing)
MCGIGGIIWREGRLSQELLKPMAQRLSHRGPDGNGSFIDGGVGLVHTRLSIIDLSGGQQPILSEDGRLAVIANGEIYNFLELRAELEARGRRFTTHSDSETILHAYAVDPENFVQRLHGMFAFALYDQTRQVLTIARDRLGIKPLFYAALPDRFVFASELKAILPLLPDAPQINPGAFLQFLQSQFSTGEETILRQITRLAPAELITIDLNLRVKRRKYWDPLQVEPRELSYAEAVEEFEPLFEQVMREHMRADVPYGLFLSGGNDSAVLLAMLDRYQELPIRAFSVGYAGVQMADELSDAKRIARRFRTEHTSVRLTRAEVFGRLPHSIWAADELMRDYASLPTALLAERAGRELKVVFTGEGGDEVFAGYGRYRMSVGERFVKNLLAPGSGGFRTQGQWHWRWVRRLFGAELAAAGDAFRAPYLAAWQRPPRSWSDLQRSQYTDMVTALPDNLLVKTDRMLMSFALEGRVPFLDHRIVEFGLSLPDRLKVHGRQGKIFLRRWAERYLPREQLYQSKRGFHVPVGEWLQGELLDRLEQKLKASRALSGWFVTRRLPELFTAQRRQGKTGRLIWCLLQFAIWHRLFIEQPGVRPGLDEDPLDWIS